MNRKILIESTGWIGAIMLLTAYFLNSMSLVTAGSPSYQLMNFAGSFLAGFYTYMKKAYPNTLLNIIWMFIAALALLNILIKK